MKTASNASNTVNANARNTVKTAAASIVNRVKPVRERTENTSLVVICRACGTSRWYADECGCKIGHTGMYLRTNKRGEVVARKMHVYKNAGESLLHPAYT